MGGLRRLQLAFLREGRSRTIDLRQRVRGSEGSGGRIDENQKNQQKKAIEVSRDSNFPKSRSMREEQLSLYICTFKRAYTRFFLRKNVHFWNSGSMFLRKRRF